MLWNYFSQLFVLSFAVLHLFYPVMRRIKYKKWKNAPRYFSSWKGADTKLPSLGPQLTLFLDWENSHHVEFAVTKWNRPLSDKFMISIWHFIRISGVFTWWAVHKFVKVEYFWKLLKTCNNGNRSSGIRTKRGPSVQYMGDFCYPRQQWVARTAFTDQKRKKGTIGS